MELKIYSPQDTGFIQKIEWNFEELKAEVTAASEEYAISVYTDDNIRNAKADRAKLNKFIEAMEAKRKEIKKKVLDPYSQFESEEKQLVAIVQKAINNIDSQVKDYERRMREDKTAKVREFYEDNIGDLAPYLPFERVFRPEYANSSTTMKSIKEEVLTQIQKVAEGLAILNEVESKFAGDMKEEFLRSYDIGAALALENRLKADEQRRAEYMAEQERRKAEREAALKAEAVRVMQAGQDVRAHVQPQPDQAVDIPAQQEEPVHVIDFRVHATASQLRALKAFLKENGIRFEPVPKQ